MLAIYVIAMIATTWHFAYGIWLFAAKWGITPGDKRPQALRLRLRRLRHRPLRHGIGSASIAIVVANTTNAPDDRNARRSPQASPLPAPA